MNGILSTRHWAALSILLFLLPSCCIHNPAWGTFSKEQLGPGSKNNTYRLTSDFHYTQRVGPKWTAHEWDKPHKWEWNGASVPSVLQWLFGDPFDGCHREASILHDFYYQTGGAGVVDRRRADELYYFGCRAGGLDGVRSILEYFAIRALGGSSWQNPPPPVLPVAGLQPPEVVTRQTKPPPREQLVALYCFREYLRKLADPEPRPSHPAIARLLTKAAVREGVDIPGLMKLAELAPDKVKQLTVDQLSDLIRK